MKNSITDVPGIEVGHAQDADALTGCTVILTRKRAVAGVDQRGATRCRAKTRSSENLCQSLYDRHDQSQINRWISGGF